MGDGEKNDVDDLLRMPRSADLAKLSLGAFPLSPPFSPKIRQYTATVCFGDDRGNVHLEVSRRKVDIDVASKDEIARIDVSAPGLQTAGTGRVTTFLRMETRSKDALADDENPTSEHLLVSVSSADGSATHGYEVHLRENCQPARLGALEIATQGGESCKLDPPFQPQVLDYTCVFRAAGRTNLTVVPQIDRRACPTCELQLPSPHWLHLNAAPLERWEVWKPWTKEVDPEERFVVRMAVSSPHMFKTTYGVSFSRAAPTAPISRGHGHIRGVAATTPEGFGHQVATSFGQGFHIVTTFLLIVLVGAIPIAILKVARTPMPNRNLRKTEYAMIGGPFEREKSEKASLWARQFQAIFVTCSQKKINRRTAAIAAVVCWIGALSIIPLFVHHWQYISDRGSPLVVRLLFFSGFGVFAAMLAVAIAATFHSITRIDPEEDAVTKRPSKAPSVHNDTISQTYPGHDDSASKHAENLRFEHMPPPRAPVASPTTEVDDLPPSPGVDVDSASESEAAPQIVPSVSSVSRNGVRRLT